MSGLWFRKTRSTASMALVMPSQVPFVEVVNLYELMSKHTSDKKRAQLMRKFRQNLRRPSGELFQVYRLLLPQVIHRCESSGDAQNRQLP